MDKIVLSGIEFFGHGGLSEAEKAIGQRYRANVVLGLDLSTASQTDSIEDTVNYADVFSLVVQAGKEKPFNLLESVAGKIAERILDLGSIREVTVRLEKLLPPIDGVIASAAVEVTRRSAR